MQSAIFLVPGILQGEQLINVYVRRILKEVSTSFLLSYLSSSFKC